MKPRIVPTTLACAACEHLPHNARCPAGCTRRFVLGAWSTSLKHSRDAGMITSDDWVAVSHAQIVRICARPEARVLVAHGEGVYLGFIAGEPAERVVHYCFVKELYRQRGIARALFGALGIDPAARFAYPVSTRALDDPARGQLRRKIPLAVRDPAVARYPKSERHRSYA